MIKGCNPLGELVRN